MYKVSTKELENIKKELISNNKILEVLHDELNDVAKTLVDKQINKNDKLIKLLEDNFYI
jgi:hypothetical protein